MKISTMRFRAAPASCIAATLALGLLAAPAQAALIGLWTFNEGDGIFTIDSSGQGNHGEIMNGGQYVTTSNGLYGISLDGINDWVQFGRPDILNFSDERLTIEIWVAITAIPQFFGNNHNIFGKNTLSWRIGYEDGNPGGSAARYNATIHTMNGTTGGEAPVDSAKPAGSFHHIVVTKGTTNDGGSTWTKPVMFYYDGACAEVSGTCDRGGRAFMVQQPDIDVRAGNNQGNQYVACIIDEIRIHDVNLTAGEVMASFLAGPSTDPADTSFLFPPSVDVSVADAFSAGFNSGTRHDLQWTDNLVGDIWSGTGSYLIGNGSRLFLFDSTTAGSATRSYRIVTSQPQ